MPITMSRTVSEAVKCFSTWMVCGIRKPRSRPIEVARTPALATEMVRRTQERAFRYPIPTATRWSARTGDRPSSVGRGGAQRPHRKDCFRLAAEPCGHVGHGRCAGAGKTEGVRRKKGIHERLPALEQRGRESDEGDKGKPRASSPGKVSWRRKSFKNKDLLYPTHMGASEELQGRTVTLTK